MVIRCSDDAQSGLRRWTLGGAQVRGCAMIVSRAVYECSNANFAALVMIYLFRAYPD